VGGEVLGCAGRPGECHVTFVLLLPLLLTVSLPVAGRSCWQCCDALAAFGAVASVALQCWFGLKLVAQGAVLMIACLL